MRVRVPRPSYLLAQLSPREPPDAAVSRVLAQLVELYRLGEIKTWQRAPRSANSTNFIAVTPKGKFVLKRHRLSEETVAHEHQVLEHLQQRQFPSPRVLLNPAGRAWS